MLPIVLNPEFARTGLVGAGDALQRRETVLAAAGFTPRRLEAGESLAGLSVLFVAGLDHEASEDWARKARAAGILVNVEDVPHLCDFNVPAIHRRGELTFSVSTKGRSPALARRLREWLEDKFGPEWEARLDELGKTRDRLLAEDVHGEALGEHIRSIIDQKGWLR